MHKVFDSLQRVYKSSDLETDQDDNIPFGGKPWRATVDDIAIDRNGEYLVSPPSKDPIQIYPSVTGTNPGDDDKFADWKFQIVSVGLKRGQKRYVLDGLLDYYSKSQPMAIGYQINHDIDLPDRFFSQAMEIHLNNIGDPFVNGTMKLNTKALERNVLDYFASLWNAKWPSDPKDPESYWGYVLTMGSTEGNLYAVTNARDYLNGSKLKFSSYTDVITKQRTAWINQIKTLRMMGKNTPSEVIKEKLEKARNMYTPVIFYSEDTHYSVPKGCHTVQLLNFGDEGNLSYPGQCPITTDGTWPSLVPSIDGGAGPGEVDIEKLCKLVDFFSSRGYPIMVVLNVGSTFKGAYDNVEEAGIRIIEIVKKNGMLMREIQDPDYPDDPSKKELRQGYWIHVDGALGASYIPYLKFAEAHEMLPPNTNTGPIFDFRLPFVSSITTSGHKWSGVGWPTGVYLTRQKLMAKPHSIPDYVGSPDSTFAGSRNALSAAVLWSNLASKNYTEKVREIIRSVALTRYAMKKLDKLDSQISIDVHARNKVPSLSIRFRQPCDALMHKYSLAMGSLDENGTTVDYAHFFCMPHVTEKVINKLVEDLAKPGAFDRD